jgi:hypothetical protein
MVLRRGLQSAHPQVGSYEREDNGASQNKRIPHRAILPLVRHYAPIRSIRLGRHPIRGARGATYATKRPRCHLWPISARVRSNS